MLTRGSAAIPRLAAVHAGLVVHGIGLLGPGAALLGAAEAEVELDAGVDARRRILRRQDLPAPNAGHPVHHPPGLVLGVRVCATHTSTLKTQQLPVKISSGVPALHCNHSTRKGLRWAIQAAA